LYRDDFHTGIVFSLEVIQTGAIAMGLLRWWLSGQSQQAIGHDVFQIFKLSSPKCYSIITVARLKVKLVE
jgi:hypothetical protein